MIILFGANLSPIGPNLSPLAQFLNFCCFFLLFLDLQYVCVCRFAIFQPILPIFWHKVPLTRLFEPIGQLGDQWNPEIREIRKMDFMKSKKKSRNMSFFFLRFCLPGTLLDAPSDICWHPNGFFPFRGDFKFLVFLVHGAPQAPKWHFQCRKQP